MIRKRRALDSLLSQAVAVGDLAGLALVYAAAVFMTLPGPFGRAISAHCLHLLLLGGCWLAVTAGRDYWRVRSLEEMPAFSRALLLNAALAAGCSALLMRFFSREGLEPGFLSAFYGGGIAAIASVRLLMLAATAVLHRAGWLRRNALVIGANERTARLLQRIRHGREYTVIGVLDDDAQRGAEFCGNGTAYLGACSALPAVLRENAIDDLFVGLTLRSNFETIQEIGREAEQGGLVVHMLADLFKSHHAWNGETVADDMAMLSLSPVTESRVALAMKRAVDFIGSSLLLAALSPLFLLVAIIIKLDSKGPIFFFQERAGRNQRRFKMVKFRSMVANAEELRRALEAQNEVKGNAFKIKRDPRVTRVGAFMRKHSIDELPQLFNVWKGEMSLVGPRPAVAADAGKYTLGERRRLSVKQGMTGLWQVSGRHSLSYEEWLRLDLGYIDSWSLYQDFIILLKTFREVVQGKNAG